LTGSGNEKSFDTRVDAIERILTCLLGIRPDHVGKFGVLLGTIAGVTIRLTVDRERWWAHATAVAASIEGLIPVVKGNGYGFGRHGLAIAAVELSPVIAVGTVHELDGLPDGCTPLVLTPTLTPPDSTEVVLTVASQHHIDALAMGCRPSNSNRDAPVRRGDELVERPDSRFADCRWRSIHR
jgi:hypothetical protein